MNGLEGSLYIEDVGGDGSVVGKIALAHSNHEFSGIWNKTTQTISFGPFIEYPMPDRTQSIVIREYFKGFLFSTPPSQEPGQDTLWTISGYFEVVDVPRLQNVYKSNAKQSVFGWFAQMTEEG